MRLHPACTAAAVSAAERQDDERLVLMRAIQATVAGFAELDRLLDRAERLVSVRRSQPQPGWSGPTVEAVSRPRSGAASRPELPA